MIIASFHLIVVGILTLARPTNFATPQGLLSEVLILVRVSTVQSLYGYRRFEHHLLFTQQIIYTLFEFLDLEFAAVSEAFALSSFSCCALFSFSNSSILSS